MFSEKFIEILRMLTNPASAGYLEYLAYRGNCMFVPAAPKFSAVKFTVGTDSRGKRVEEVCTSYGIPCTCVGTQSGPVISKIFIKLKQGVLCSRLETISKDLAREIGCKSIAIEGNDAYTFIDPMTRDTLDRCCSIAIPAKDRQVVPFGNIFNVPQHGMAIPAIIGVDPVGNPVHIDLAKAPHMLVAGQTGSGKSVCINSIITSIYLAMPPGDVRFLLIDPKQVELSCYQALPNVINRKTITNPVEAVNALGWLVSMMEYRYSVLAKLGFRSIKEFNAAVTDRNKIFTIPGGMRRKMPYVVAVVDEFADLMMTSPANLTAHVMRLAQKARAVGIHLVLATQRPSTKIITGDLKCNIPTRIAFKVASAVDSMTILGCGGAEKLLGCGDMLLAGDNSDEPLKRIHGCYLSDDEISRTLSMVSNCAKFAYDDLSTYGSVDFSAGYAETTPGVPDRIFDAPAIAYAMAYGDMTGDRRTADEVVSEARTRKFIK